MNNNALSRTSAMGDLTNILNSWIGSDRLIEKILSDNSIPIPNYPPYDLIKYADNKYQIIMALAGFTIDEIDITLDRGNLKISSVKKPETGEEPVDTSQYIRRGIAKRGFGLSFNLSEHMVVDSATLKDGLLSVDLSVNIPEELQPRKILINDENPLIL